MKWISQNYSWLISLVIQSIIAVLIFLLSKKTSDAEKLAHKEMIKQKADELLGKINREKLNRKVYLVNITRYHKDYPSNKEKLMEGYSHISAEIKSTKFDGIEFFAEMPVEVYENSDKELSLDNKNGKKVFNAYGVGLVPYEWIEYVDLDGDEYGYIPLFFCRFKGSIYWKSWRRLLPFGYPYKNIRYYKINKTYKESDPFFMKYSLIDQIIKK